MTTKPKPNAIEALTESKPPATDPFTYLTIIGEVLSPDVLPTLHEILQDAELTQQIGWDLVAMLVSVKGSEECLQTVAQLGNPREVILKVLEVLVQSSEEENADEDDNNGSGSARTFVTLLGMLGILHKRLKVRYPSRFVHSTLQAVLHAYRPEDPEATAAVVSLVRALSTEQRPPLPTRKSSTKLDTPFIDSDPTMNAPDPEAMQSEEPAPTEPALVNRLLQSFITSAIEKFVNRSSLEWGARLLEFYNPERVVFRKSVLRAFKEDDALLARDALVGQLSATARDLGLSSVTAFSLEEIFETPADTEPLAGELDDSVEPSTIKLATGGVWCLIAYWLFSCEVFDAEYDQIQMAMLPDHAALLKRLVREDPQEQICNNPGTTEALLVIGLWLDNAKRVMGQGAEVDDFMSYHHQLTLVSVFHPSLSVRNVATVLSGLVLHADPEPQHRLKILEDLLENCIFSALQASAVSWLREEIIIAQKTKANNAFSNTVAIDTLQNLLFPSMEYLKEQDAAGLWEFWAQNHPYHLQTANFAYFLFKGKGFGHIIPEGLGAAVRQRYIEPLIEAGGKLGQALEKKEVDDMGMGVEALMQLDVLKHQLGDLAV